MKIIEKALAVIIVFSLVAGCSTNKQEKMTTTFGDDVSFLQQFTPIIALTAPDGKGKIALSPGLQGRVMTSSASGDAGKSYGWINRDFFSSKDTLPHMNPFGGEERFWLGPEGGQFALYFKAGDPFDFTSWQTPALIDTEPFLVAEQTSDKVVFTKDASLINYSNFQFQFTIKREIKIIPIEENSVAGVAYQSTNTVTNVGIEPWQKETGLLSIWLLGMFNPTDGITMIIPFHPGDEDELGPIVIDDYFGKVPADRLIIKDSVCYFKGDGNYRSKIGYNPKRAKSTIGSYDAINHVLTIVQYSKPDSAIDYVNSKWEIHKEPYRGDVVNLYNDGPPSPGVKPMGPFYELETSSPAVELKSGESITHQQTTYHFEGDESDLSLISQKMLGVDLRIVSSIF